MLSDMDSKMKQIERLEAALKIEDEMRAVGGTGREFQSSPKSGKSENPRASEEYKAAFERFLANGTAALSREEIKMMAADPDSEGGYLVAPQQFVNELL